MQIASMSFWFAAYPMRFSPVFEKGFFALFIIVALLGLGLRVYARNKDLSGLQRRLFADGAYAGYWLALLGLVWWFCTREEIRFFGQRFWFVLWVLLTGWVAFRLYSRFKSLPILMASAKQKSESKKYLPRRSR